MENFILNVKSEQVDFWGELSKEKQAEIHLGIEQLDAGKRVSFDDFLKNNNHFNKTPSSKQDSQSS